MFHFTPSPSFRTPSGAVLRQLYNCVELLRVADAKLDLVIEEFNRELASEHLYKMDFVNTQAVARLFVTIFQELIGGQAPTIRESTFKGLLAYENRETNTPHFEGALITLSLALKYLDAAMNLSAELDGTEIGDAYELMIAAHTSIQPATSLLECNTAGGAPDAIVDALYAGRTIADAEQEEDERHARVREEVRAWRAARQAAETAAASLVA